MSNCGTCRFKAAKREERCVDGPDGRPDYVEVEVSTCVRIIHGNHDFTHGEEALTPQQPAVVIDGSGYQARLLVTDNFGCVLHEPKES